MPATISLQTDHSISLSTGSDYVHRVGRTARAGRDGVAISIMSQYDVARLHAIEAYIGIQLPALEGTAGSAPDTHPRKQAKRRNAGDSDCGEDEVDESDNSADESEREAAAARHARRKREIEDEVLRLMNKVTKAWNVAELRLKAREAEGN